MTTDLVCGLLCLAISFIRNDRWMIAGPIVANIDQAIAFAFSRTANKAIITEVVEKDEIVTYNARLELVLQVVGVSSLVFSFPCFTICQSPCDPLLDALTFFIAFVLVAFLPKEEAKVQEKETVHGEKIFFSDIKDGLALYLASERDFLPPPGGFQRQFLFFAALSFYSPFLTLRVKGAYATILNLRGYWLHHRSLDCNKFKSSMEMLLFY